MGNDIRYAFRTLLKSPGFAAVAVVALALGIGPNTAIFSIVSAVLLRPLPIQDADRVVSVWENNLKLGFPQVPASEANYLDWKRQAQSFERMGTAFALPEYGLNVVVDREPDRVPGGKASADFFPVLGVQPAAGRTFLPEEDRPNGPGAAIVSYGFWQRKLHGDHAAIGRRILIDGAPRTIVGVLPAGMDMFGRIDVWLPVAMDPNGTDRSNRTWGVFAKLKPGVTPEQAQAEMTTISARLAAQYPDSNENWGASVLPVHKLITGTVAPPLMILLGAVGLLLLLACANVTNLLLARGAARSREIAVRAALGASRGRVVRQLLTESVILSLLGGAVGLLLARWCVGLLRGIIPDSVPLMQQMGIDWRVLLFTFAASLATGLIFGAAPAIRMSRTELSDTLKAAGRALAGGGERKLRSALVVAEIALALVLAVAAGLLARSFAKLMSVNPGMHTDDVLTMQLNLASAQYPNEQQRARFYTDVLARVRALPGVESAGGIHFLPFRSVILNSRISVWSFRIPGRPPARKGEEPIADGRIITPDYFRTLGIPVVQGRAFDERDAQGAPNVVIVNEALAHQYFPGQDPVGRELQLWPLDQPPARIVGVVPDVKLYGLDRTPDPALYVPHAQRPVDVLTLVVRSPQDPQTLAAAIRREVAALDPQQPVADVRTMASVVSDSTMLRRISMALIGAFAGLALVLATVGIYGLTAYSVSQRMHEIGLRMALGAGRVDILRNIAGRGGVLALIGVAIGFAGSLGVSKVLKSFLFGISATDPLVLAGVPAVLLVIALLATTVPARRAIQVPILDLMRRES